MDENHTNATLNNKWKRTTTKYFVCGRIYSGPFTEILNMIYFNMKARSLSLSKDLFCFNFYVVVVGVL